MTDQSESAGDDGSDGDHVCEACGERFESERALDRHVCDVGMVD